MFLRFCMDLDYYTNIKIIDYKDILIRSLIFIHIIFFISWIGLFFIPKSVWSNRIFYHFWYVSGVILLNLVWGGFLKLRYKKGNLFVCPLTTMTQYFRGYKISDVRNNKYLFVGEILSKFNINYSRSIMIIGGTISLLIVSINYILIY